MDIEAQTQELPKIEKANEVNGNDVAVQSAVKFLKNPSVQNYPTESKIHFLMNKGLSVAQIQYAFAQAGQSVSLEKIEAARGRRARGGAGSPAPTHTQNFLYTSPSPPPPSAYAGNYQGYDAAAGLPAASKEADWRDVVIGLGAAALAGFAGVKLFQWYSPYEIRRKGEGPGKVRRSSRRRQADADALSDDRDAAPLARPALPPPLPQVPAAKEEEIKRLEGELQDAKEALMNERKRSADLSLSVAKVRGEKQQIVNKNERLTQRVEELEDKVKQLETAAREREENDNNNAAAADAEEEERASVPEEEAASIPDGESSIPGITANVSPQGEDSSPIPAEELPLVEISKSEAPQTDLTLDELTPSGKN